jgi:hypothetical protein
MKLKRIRERNQRILTDLNGFIGGDSGDSQKADFQYSLSILWEVVFLSVTLSPLLSPSKFSIYSI